jgi:hypothetical protein
MEYLRLKSVTWWAGVASILLGLASMYFDGAPPAALEEVARVIAMLHGHGDASPAAMIVMGFGLIGIRAKLERMAQ